MDEVNLLNDQIVDLFLDAAASGTNVVEREGISFSHASRFILVGTMNPEEGDLRPQLHDRFGLSVTIEGIHALPERVQIIKRRLAFEQDPEGFRARWAAADVELAQRMVQARGVLNTIVFTEDLLETAARLAVAMDTDGHPNVSCFGQDPLDETFFHARDVKRRGIQAIFVDTETNPTAMGYGYEIAARMDATYLPLDRLCL